MTNFNQSTFSDRFSFPVPHQAALAQYPNADPWAQFPDAPTVSDPWAHFPDAPITTERALPPLPPGFTLETPPQPFPQVLPPLPPGQPQQVIPPLPPGFTLDPPPTVTQGGGVNGATKIEPARPRPQQSFARDLRVGTQGVGAGLADVVGMPVDLMTGAFNLGIKGVNAATGPFDIRPISEIKKPFGGSESIKNAASSISSLN